MTVSRTLVETGLILCLSVVAAMTVNTLSPRGIALFGQWDVTKGVISAVARDDAVVHQREIRSVADALAVYQAGKALFVDARDTVLFEEGHIKGAVNLFVYEYDERFESFSRKFPDRDGLIVTYCSGRECEDSHILADYLEEDGYTNVRVFIDGFPAWHKEGLPVETGP